MAVIRILQVFTVMDRGGSESMIMNYYRNIDKEKIQFDFLVHRKKEAAFDDEIKALGGNIYRLDPINPLFPQKYYAELRAFFKSHYKYQIIHSHLNAFSCFPLKIAKEFNIPCRIAHAHIAINSVSLKTIMTYNESFTETMKKVLKNLIKKKIHKDATHYFSCGEKAGKWLFGTYTSFFTMNNAIDSEKFKYNKAVSNEYRKQFNLENELVIGHIGRFNTQKNHTFLLEIFASLLQKEPNSTLILIGGGDMHKKLELEAKSLNINHKVKFLGVRTDISKLFQMLDIFVFPSFYEGLPVTLIEAQAAGLKIIASDTITKEVKLTDNIQFLPITEPADFWSKKILKTRSYLKEDTMNHIVEGEYDILKNSKHIEQFYLQQIS